ncbi:hypothetical protein GCK32_015805 [Trichostrongylus colubriformis]|uniref:Uncharacterized protein n=1 Tax=Trichostrongylus colubriformis TaxID=6319 RepID=A0AAN8FEG0_TRICO
MRGPFESDITHIQHSTHSDELLPRELGGTLVRAFPSEEHGQAASETNHVDSMPHGSSHTDIANNMDTVNPFPMQFLDGSQAQRQTSKWTLSTEASSTVILEQYTLPPTVMIISNASNPVILQQVPLRSQTLARKEKSMSENHKYSMTERRISPTIVSVMCMAVLAMAMVAVVIGLCILQRRKESDCYKNWCSAA